MEKSHKVTVPNQPLVVSNTEKRNHSTFGGPESQTDPVMPGKDLNSFSANGLISSSDAGLKMKVIFEECYGNKRKKRVKMKTVAKKEKKKQTHPV